jgi:rRNA maturation endonuclease Nob1
MPTFKHPCPHCGTFINRDVAACPACGRADPFAPARCPKCRAAIDDLSWVACSACGQPVDAAAAAAGSAATSAVGGPTQAGPTGQTPVESPAPPTRPEAPETRLCSGCRTALPSEAHFCRECGTAADERGDPASHQSVSVTTRPASASDP